MNFVDSINFFLRNRLVYGYIDKLSSLVFKYEIFAVWLLWNVTIDTKKWFLTSQRFRRLLVITETLFDNIKH